MAEHLLKRELVEIAADQERRVGPKPGAERGITLGRDAIDLTQLSDLAKAAQQLAVLDDAAGESGADARHALERQAVGPVEVDDRALGKLIRLAGRIAVFPDPAVDRRTLGPERRGWSPACLGRDHRVGGCYGRRDGVVWRDLLGSCFRGRLVGRLVIHPDHEAPASGDDRQQEAERPSFAPREIEQVAPAHYLVNHLRSPSSLRKIRPIAIGAIYFTKKA